MVGPLQGELVTVSPRSFVLSDVQGHVEFSNVSFSYGLERTDAEAVLADISFTAEPDEYIRPRRTVGAGNSTPMKRLMRMCDVTWGPI